MGRKKLEKNEAVLEDKPKKRGRPKVSEGAPSSPKLEKKKKVKSIYDEDGEMLSLDDIKNSLLKKAKSSGIIDQSDIYDALNQFDLDDDTIADLINFFKENKKSDFLALAIAADTDTPCSPCGACRQVISELFPRDGEILLTNLKGDSYKTNIDELLPLAFSGDDLK